MTEEELKLRKGLKILSGGNFVQKLFGNANYDKILRSYKKEFIQTRRRKDGTTYLYHTGKKSEITENQIQDDIELKFTGSKTPIKDFNYLKAKRNLEGLDKEITWNNLTFNDLYTKVRRRFSEKQYAGEDLPNEGQFLGTKFDINRKERLTKRVQKFKKGSSYDIDVPGEVKKSESPLTLFLNTFESKQMINKAKEDVPLIETPYKLPWSSTQQKSINEINAAEKEVNNAESL